MHVETVSFLESNVDTTGAVSKGKTIAIFGLHFIHKIVFTSHKILIRNSFVLSNVNKISVLRRGEGVSPNRRGGGHKKTKSDYIILKQPLTWSGFG